MNSLSQSTDPIPLAEWRDRILSLYEPPLMSPHSHRNMAAALGRLIALPGLAAGTTADLTTATIAAFVKSREGVDSPNTTRTHLNRIRAACGLAVAEGWLRINPVAVRRRWVRALPPKQPRVHSRAEIVRVLELARHEAESTSGWEGWKAWRLYALAAVYCYAGLRKTEALTLQVPDVDLVERMLYLTARRGYEGKTEASAQPVPIAGELLPVLAAWLGRVDSLPDGLPGPANFHPYLNRPSVQAEGEPWLFPSALRGGPWLGGSHSHRPHDVLKALGRRAGVPDFTPHSLRHAWATHAEHWGLTNVQIARILRHTSVRTQTRYRHAELENMREMVAGVAFGVTAPHVEPTPPAPTPPTPVPGRRGKPPGKRSLGKAAEAELVAFHAKGWSYRELQARYQLSRSNVARILARWKDGPPESYGNEVLDDAGVLEARRLHRRGTTVADLARRYGVHHVTMRQALRGATWGHVPME